MCMRYRVIRKANQAAVRMQVRLLSLITLSAITYGLASLAFGSRLMYLGDSGDTEVRSSGLPASPRASG